MKIMVKSTFIVSLSAVAVMVTACAVGPDYKKPDVPVQAAFKEAEGWKLATPQDLVPRGQWWQFFCDSLLNELEEQVNINNQNIRLAEANFRQAQALVAQARAGFFPTIGLNSSITRDKSATSQHIGNSYSANLASSWEPDLWGKIRRTYEANSAGQQASEASLAAARLSAQAELAINYLSLRVADEQKRLLDETVANYSKSLALTEDLYKNGISTRSDYLQAKVQLESAQAQAIDVESQRAAFEHAIAVLIGKAPSELSIAHNESLPHTPHLPPVLPSYMLERRPDIAAAERNAAAANAKIGLAEAAFFPDFTLSADTGYASNAIARWFTTPTRIWSVGPSVLLSVFDAGLRKAQTDAAIAAYDATVATYRQTVLAAYAEAEDNLAALRVLNREQEIRNAALADARDSTEVITNQYKEGITSYLNVATAQTTELNNALSALSVKKQRLVASVNLIKALGGTWQLSNPGKVTAADFATQDAPLTAPTQAEAQPKPSGLITLTPPVR